MMKTSRTYRTTNRHHAEASAVPSAATAAVTLSTLLTLLAVAVLIDAVADSGFPNPNAPYAREVVRDTRTAESQRSASLSRRIVLAARDFLGTNVQSIVAHHHLIEATTAPILSPEQGAKRMTRIGFRPPEIPLDHLLNLPPPSTSIRIAESPRVA